MAGLIDELIASATDSGITTVELLRKAKIVSAKLEQTETSGWIDAELSGYFGEANAPDYRKLASRLYRRDPIYGWLPVVFDDERINAINNIRGIGAPISELEENLRTSQQPAFFLSVPPDAAAQLARWGAPTRDLYHGVSRSSVAALVEAVRTRVLEWALALHKAGVRGKDLTFSRVEQQQATSVVVHFNGTTNFAGVIGISSGIAAQNLTQEQTSFAGAAHDIVRKLREGAAEVEADDAELLNAAADSVEDAAKVDNPIGLRKALRFGKAALVKVGGFVAKAAAEHEIDQLLGLIPM